MRRLILSLPVYLFLSLSGCALFGGGAGGFGTPPNNSQVYATQLEQYRAQIKAQPGTYQPATLFAATVKGLIGTSVAPDLDQPALIEEAIGHLDAVDEAEYVYAALSDKGSLLAAAGRQEEALAAFQASLADKPNVVVIPEMVPLVAATGGVDEVSTVCAGVREEIEDGDRINILMHHCGGSGDLMEWASPEDREAFAQFQAEQAQRAAEREAEREAERQAEQERLQASFSQPDPAPSSEPSSSSSAAPAPSGGSVSVKNECKQKVRVFRGRVNGSYPGGGTFGWHSPNSISSYSLSGSDQLCIVTENDREIVSCAGSGSSLKITESCAGFAPR